jgi:GNAT superfamily N-acetyltransferase
MARQATDKQSEQAAIHAHQSGETMVNLTDTTLESSTPNRRAHVVLRDGSTLVIRFAALTDRPAIAALLTGLSVESRAYRFHSAAVAITPATLDLVTAGHALVATFGDQLVALGSYVPLPETMQADLALVVADAAQGQGIGAALAACLARDAERAGIRWLRAEVLGSNRRMLRLLHSLGYHMTLTQASGVILVEIELCPEPSVGG